MNRCLNRKGCAIVLVLTLLAGCGDGSLPVVGGEARLSDWRDRGVVINYWAEWCAPCREEIPEFNELYHQAGAAGPIVVGVNYDGLSGADLDGVIERMQIDFPTLLVDPQQRFGYERPTVMPTTVVLNHNLEVEHVLVGPQNLTSLEAALADH